MSIANGPGGPVLVPGSLLWRTAALSLPPAEAPARSSAAAARVPAPVAAAAASRSADRTPDYCNFHGNMKGRPHGEITPWRFTREGYFLFGAGRAQ